MIKILAIPAFNDNYIWLFYDQNSQAAWVVDPGIASPVIEHCTAHNLLLSGILITHHHADHTGGIKELLQYARAPVYGPANQAISEITERVRDNDQVTLPVGTFSVLEVPGHTLDHIAYYSDSLLEEPVLFIGDTLFSAGCGRLFEGTPKTMFDSLNHLIASLPKETLVYCTHEYTQANIKFALTVEPDNTALHTYSKQVNAMRHKGQPSLPTTLYQEQQINPFLRTTKTPVIKQASEWAKQSLETPLEVFATLRRWKDDFK